MAHFGLRLIATFVVLICATGLAAQVERLPPVAPGGAIGAARASLEVPTALPTWEAPADGKVQAVPISDPLLDTTPYHPGAFPNERYPSAYIPEELLGCQPPIVKRIPDFKSGFFQKLAINGTWMPSFDDADVGFTDFETFATFAAPLPTTDWPILLTPFFKARYLDGPTAPDLPSQLYDTHFQFRWLPKVTERLRIDLTIEPGMHGDFEKGDADAFRLPGHVVGIYDLTPTRKLVVGALYLDREDIDVLPAGGLILTPTDDWQLDLIFPQPKIAQRLWADGETEYWHYIAAEFGSGPYSIRRADGRQDVIITSDYRLLYGVERKQLGGIWTKFEAGYVFGREIEFVSGDPIYRPEATVLLRGGVSF